MKVLAKKYDFNFYKRKKQLAKDDTCIKEVFIDLNKKLKFAKKNALIMHPGPMNRGVEIDTKLADDINVSLVKEQVELGVAVRMACLKKYCK